MVWRARASTEAIMRRPSGRLQLPKGSGLPPGRELSWAAFRPPRFTLECSVFISKPHPERLRLPAACQSVQCQHQLPKLKPHRLPPSTHPKRAISSPATQPPMQHLGLIKILCQAADVCIVVVTRLPQMIHRSDVHDEHSRGELRLAPILTTHFPSISATTRASSATTFPARNNRRLRLDGPRFPHAPPPADMENHCLHFLDRALEHKAASETAHFIRPASGGA